MEPMEDTDFRAGPDVADDSSEGALARLVVDQARALGGTAMEALLAHPDAVRSAFAVALGRIEAPTPPKEYTISGPTPRLLDRHEATEALLERTRRVEHGDEELLTSDEFAKRAGAKSRQSVHNWLGGGRIVGWKGAKRGYVFPAKQLDERGRPLPGLEAVLPYFDSRYSAWRWLTDRHTALGGARPIEMLRRNDVASVQTAARGYAQGDFG